MKSKSKTKPIYSKQIEGAANSVQSTFDANQPRAQALSEQMGGLGSQLLTRAGQISPGLRAAQGYATDVLGGRFIQGNPQLEAMIARTRDNVMGDVNANAAMRGRVGGDSHAFQMGRGLSDSELGLRYGNYSDEMNRMRDAAGMMPGLDAAEYQGVAPALMATQGAVETPYIGSRNLASGIGALLGQYTKTTQKPGIAGLLAQAAGNAASFYGGGG